MLELAAVSARYETPRGAVRAVSDITLTVQSSEILGIAGESGCGKSSLLKIMYGNIRPPMRLVGGTVTVSAGGTDGQAVTLRNEQIRKGWWKTISYVPQGAMSVLNPVARIERQFMDAVPSGHREARAMVRANLASYLSELGLPSQVLRSYPHQLSGGMRQRVVIAMATFLHPAVVLADEPTTALDVIVQRSILTLLTHLQSQMKNSLIIVSHDMGVHYQITHRMGIMYAGRMVERGPTARIFERPLHPYTRALINALPKIGDTGRREGIPGLPPNLLAPATGCPFAARCPAVMDICRRAAPTALQIEPDHVVECHLYG
jgi:peptide/nickel transport system ATP-binding protein